jgi:hypothetical protein
MKKEVSPGVVAAIIALVVIVLGVFFYRQAGINPPSAHPQMHFDSSGKPPAPAAGQGDAGGNGAASGGR